MATEVLMPKMGATMESGTIIRWFRQTGETVEAGEPLVEIMTDKINIEVEADISGVLLKVNHEADEVVEVGVVIGYIGQVGEQVGEAAKPDSATAAQTYTELQQTDAGDVASQAAESDVPAGRVRKTPAARKLAAEQGIDLHSVKGTGPSGRIQRTDVEAHIASDPVMKATSLARKIAADREIELATIEGSGVNGKIMRDDVIGQLQKKHATTDSVAPAERIKLEGMRKVIAQRMGQSAFTAPHVTLVSEVDMSDAMRMRKELLPVVEKATGQRLSYTEIIVKFVALALCKHPLVNASLQGDYIVMNRQVNVGLAVAVPNGLMVPVITDADRKGLAELTAECKKLGGLARAGKLTPDLLKGGTFTISNLGMYAVDAFTPIINQPESAILGVGRITEKAVGVNGTIQLRPMMTLSLSFDHRVMDGAPAAAFLTELKQLLENPFQALI
ncbi:dihydrolipoamide acetyltransferase family protein [Brevibacillus sp. NRS-1366]|uniref:dihydrolipoamide acetyltransferase family protein n=1 Tax=Brevibacillus sp. NRS-1366 TaxID=3233899 RepID=UPI003D1B2F11